MPQAANKPEFPKVDAASLPRSDRRMGITRRDAASTFADQSVERRRRGAKPSFPEIGFSTFNPLKISSISELRIKCQKFFAILKAILLQVRRINTKMLHTFPYSIGLHLL
jgi:hypothetical protein